MYKKGVFCMKKVVIIRSNCVTEEIVSEYYTEREPFNLPKALNNGWEIVQSTPFGDKDGSILLILDNFDE